MIPFLRETLPALASAGCLTGPALAGAPSGEPAPEAAASTTPAYTSEYERLWSHFTLYKNDDNPILQEFSLQGRLQLQYAWGEADQGEYYSGDRPTNTLWGDDIEVRRWRLGFKSKWFRQWKFDGQIDVNSDIDPFYRQIYDLTLTYAPSESFNLGIGKYKANNFGIEHFTSSKEILTIERTLLANQLFVGELTGARFNGKKNNWQYAAGIYSGDITQEFSSFETGMIYQGSLGYDFHERFGLEKALIKLDVQYSDDITNGTNRGNEPRLSATNSGRYGTAVSLNGHFEQGKFGLYTDILGAEGRGANGDVWGIILTPSYYLTDGLQLVARYQYANGDNDALQLQSRYERLAAAPGGTLTDGGRGENYHAFYLGLNYYLYGHKLKLMAGAEYHQMDNGNDAGGEFDGVTGLVGMRMFF
jgi:phosphate-selective porin OprO/OprP